MGKKGLTDKELSFCQQYVVFGGNGTQAVLHSLYKTDDPNTAHAIAVERLRKPTIVAEIARLRKKTMASLDISMERTLYEVSLLAYQNANNLYDGKGQLIPIHELPEAVSATVSSFEIEEARRGGGKLKQFKGSILKKLKTWPKEKAQDMLMKYHGAYEADNKQRGIGDALEQVLDTIAGRPRDLPKRGKG